MIVDQTKEIAKFILQLVATASVRADDQTIANVGAVKGWLNAIAEGQLIVRPVTDEERKVPAPVAEAVHAAIVDGSAP